MTHPARAKGNRAEVELAKLLSGLTGWVVRRRLQEGRADDTGDLEGVPYTCVQVKDFADPQRAIREGLLDLDVQQARAAARYGVLFVRRRGGRWLAVMSPIQWAQLATDATHWRTLSIARAREEAERLTQDQGGYPGGPAS